MPVFVACALAYCGHQIRLWLVYVGWDLTRVASATYNDVVDNK